jgi:aminoglycoside/choline kinase family phosphotransferase
VEKEKVALLSKMFESWCGYEPQQISFLPQSGSYRSYCRMLSGSFSALGAWNRDVRENVAFLSFSKSFKKAGLPVPEIFDEDIAEGVYLLEDFGSYTLFDLVKGHPFNEGLKNIYKKCLVRLEELQVKGKDCIDYGKCYPRAAFDIDSMTWDLNYFKYYFLILVRIPFDEQALENDFRLLTTYLIKERSDYFLFRDFQSSNILVYKEEPYFIDYQGGRRGALQYDPASLLFDAKARIPKEIRNELIEFYVEALSEKIDIDKCNFMSHYQGFVLIRLMQAMGAFGFRGIVEKKPGFMESIPPALGMFADLLDEWSLPVEIPELKACFNRMLQSDYLKNLLTKQ